MQIHSFSNFPDFFPVPHAKVGADLFGIYEESEVKSPEKSPIEKTQTSTANTTRLVRTASMISPDEVP